MLFILNTYSTHSVVDARMRTKMLIVHNYLDDNCLAANDWSGCCLWGYSVASILTAASHKFGYFNLIGLLWNDFNRCDRLALKTTVKRGK